MFFVDIFNEFLNNDDIWFPIFASIEEEFDVQIPTVEVIPSNFNSAKAIWDLIVRLEEEG